MLKINDIQRLNTNFSFNPDVLCCHIMSLEISKIMALNHLHAAQLFMFLMLSAVFFFKFNILKNMLSRTLSEASKGLNSDKDWCDLGPNCLQRLSA